MYLNFILEGTFTDNLGNYGIWDNASTVTLQNNNVINLQGYGKRIFQNKEITYIKGFRNKQEQQAGVGKTEVVNASRSLMPLVGMSCTYAVNFYEDNAFFVQKVEDGPCSTTGTNKQYFFWLYFFITVYEFYSGLAAIFLFLIDYGHFIYKRKI